MSIICSIIYTLFFISTISCALPPRVVYSGSIHNAQNSPIDCRIFWHQPTGDLLDGGLFTINQNEDHLIIEKTVEMKDGWTAACFIQKIQCGNLELNAPFDKVVSPSKDWKFIVQTNEILSAGSN